jgi:hypothetical protein
VVSESRTRALTLSSVIAACSASGGGAAAGGEERAPIVASADAAANANENTNRLDMAWPSLAALGGGDVESPGGWPGRKPEPDA